MLIFLWDKSGRTKETPFRAKIGLKHLKKEPGMVHCFLI